MPGYYLTFLLDLAGEGEDRAAAGTVRYEPDPRTFPTTAFMWKVVLDAADRVIVKGLHGRKRVVIATGTFRGGTLVREAQREASVPTDYQWNLVESSLRAELARRIAMTDRPADSPYIDDERVADPVAPASREDAREGTASGGRPARRSGGADARPRKRKLAIVVVVGLAINVALVGAGVVATCGGTGERARSPRVPASATPRIAEPGPVAPSDAPGASPSPLTADAVPRATPAEQIAAAPSFSAAIAIAKPAMRDTGEELPDAARQLAAYAGRLVWADVDVPAETTIGHVLKDPEIERGKRMCAEGTLRSIERRDVERRKVYVGTLQTGEGDLVAFVAVGSTGELVKRSRGRLCGAVLGRAGSGVAMLGMFDLPENRQPVVEQ